MKNELIKKLKELKAKPVQSLKDSINVLGMPDFRKLGMGLQQQIDDIIGSFQRINLDALPDKDHSGNGLKTNHINAGATITFGQVLYLASDGEWALADADASSTCQGLISIALEGGTDGNALNVLLNGFMRDDSWNWTAGGLIYASTTAGGLTQTAPSGTDDVVKIVGLALTPDIIYFHPEITVVVHT